MRLRCQELLSVLAIVSWATVAAAQAPPTDPLHVIYAARMLDVRQGRILSDVVVVIREIGRASCRERV